jgi:hypothetical protein
VWWEGTAQLAAALRWLKRDREAVSILARLREAQLRDGIAERYRLLLVAV